MLDMLIGVSFLVIGTLAVVIFLPNILRCPPRPNCDNSCE